jgi:hypothetical protein
MALKIPRTREQKLKIVVTIGLLAPSIARIWFPGLEVAERIAGTMTLVSGLFWLWEF